MGAMKRLKLEIDALSVVSFPTAPSTEARGTVQAHVGTTPGCVDDTLRCTEALDCVVTSGINSCWCSEYNTCECTSPV
jgi:hypothetical protein